MAKTRIDKVVKGNIVNHNHGLDDLLPEVVIPQVAGSDKQVQFNDGGAFGADSELAWDKTVKSLNIGSNVALLPDNPLAIQASVDSYIQVNIQNTSTGTAASSDYIATADNGDDSSNYADFGICNSAYASATWDVVGPDDSYIFGDGGNVAIGTLTPSKKVKFFVAGTIHEAHPADVVAEADANGINLPSGKTYRINGVDITTTGMTNPMTASGDIIHGGTGGTPVALAKGVDGKVLKLVSGLPSWEAETGVADGDKGDITVSASGATWTVDNATITEAKLNLADNTTADATTLKHGLLPKLSGTTTTFLRGDGTYATPSGATIEDIIGVTVDGGGSAITTGSKGYRQIPYNCTINSWTVLGKESGSCVIDVKKCTYAGFPTTSSIAGTEKPTLSSTQKNQDLTLSTWTTSLTAGDILEFNVESASTVTRVHLFISITRS